MTEQEKKPSIIDEIEKKGFWAAFKVTLGIELAHLLITLIIWGAISLLIIIMLWVMK